MLLSDINILPPLEQKVKRKKRSAYISKVTKKHFCAVHNFEFSALFGRKWIFDFFVYICTSAIVIKIYLLLPHVPAYLSKNDKFFP